MTLWHRASAAWRQLLGGWRTGTAPGQLVVMACSDEAEHRACAIDAIKPRDRAVIVGGIQSNLLTVRSARLSLVAACKYGRTPILQRGTRLIAVVNRLELTPLLEARFDDLPAFDRLRVGLGIALLWAPELLIVDEPAGLPEPERTRLAALFRRLQLRTKLTTVWLTSRPLDIASLTDQPLEQAQVNRLVAGTSR